MLKRLDGLIKLGLPKPLYYEPIRSNPPLSFTTSTTSKAKKAKPPKITFPEDQLRAHFYRDHPLELDAPLQMTAPSLNQCDSEWAIQRQLQLMSSPIEPLSAEEAYARACDELKRRRVEGEIGRRLAGRGRALAEEAGAELLDTVLLEERRILEQEKQRTMNGNQVKFNKRK